MKQYVYCVHLAKVLLPEVEDEPVLSHLVDGEGGEVVPAGALKTAIAKLRMAPAGEPKGDPEGQSEPSEQPPPEAEGRDAECVVASQAWRWIWLTEPLTYEETRATVAVVGVHDEKYPWT